MKSIETVLAILGWVIMAIIIWAIAPFLLKLMEMAQRLHEIFQ